MPLQGVISPHLHESCPLANIISRSIFQLFHIHEGFKIPRNDTKAISISDPFCVSKTMTHVYRVQHGVFIPFTEIGEDSAEPTSSLSETQKDEIYSFEAPGSQGSQVLLQRISDDLCRIGEVEVEVKKVRFTQNTISPKFRDGRCVRALAAELRSNPAKAQDLPKLQVFSHGSSGTLYSLDNRRLFAMKVAGIGRVLAQKVQPKRTLRNKRLTTTSSGRVTVFHDADPIRDLVDIEVADDCTGIRPDCSHQVQLTRLGSVEPKIMTMCEPVKL